MSNRKSTEKWRKSKFADDNPITDIFFSRRNLWKIESTRTTTTKNKYITIFFSSCVYNKMCIKWYIKTTNLPLPRPQQQRILFIQLNSKNIYFQNSFFSLVSFILLNCQRAGSVQCSLRAKILIVSEMLECHYPIWRLAKWQTDQSENFVTKIKIKKQEIAIILPFS